MLVGIGKLGDARCFYKTEVNLHVTTPRKTRQKAVPANQLSPVCTFNKVHCTLSNVYWNAYFIH